VLIGPPTLLMGLSFPLLQKAVHRQVSALGSRVGILMVANIAGSTAGAILTGWLALRVLGTAGTFKAVVVGCGLFAVCGLGHSVRARPRARASAVAFLGLALATALLVSAMPTSRELWARLHASSPSRIVYDEDETGVSLVRIASAGLSGRSHLFASGVGQSWIPYGDIHTVLGALPAFMHPRPRDAAIIGLGSGDTVFGLAGRREIERITCIEIVKSQLATLKAFDRVYGYAGLKMLLSDPRIEHVTADGRLYAMRSEGRFDIIEADALRPGSAYAGNPTPSGTSCCFANDCTRAALPSPGRPRPGLSGPS
jgi:hypothetical protein